jgi:hypothetical protein
MRPAPAEASLNSASIRVKPRFPLAERAPYGGESTHIAELLERSRVCGVSTYAAAALRLP